MAKLHRRVRKVSNPHLIACLAALLSVSTASAQDDDGPAVLSAEAPEVERLAALSAQLGDADRRAHAVEQLGQLGVSDLPAIRGRIAQLQRGRPPQNWARDIMTRFRRRGRDEAAGHPDLARGAIAELAQEHSLPREHARVVAMAEPALLWRALDRIGTVEAQRAVFPLIALDGGLWTPAARGWARRRGPALAAAIIHARRDGNRYVREWGRFGYDLVGANNPGRLIPSVSQESLPDLFAAYAEARTQSAMRVIVSFVGSERRAIRRAARAAMQRYGGGSIWILRTAFRNHTGEYPPRQWGWRRLSAELYSRVDARRMRSVQAALERGQEARRAGDLAAMQSAFDDVLARMPELEEPGPVASGYAAVAAHAAQAGDIDGAQRAYRRALRLAPDHTESARWRAELAYLSVQRAGARGIWDEAALRRVLDAVPDHAGATAALAALAPPTLPGSTTTGPPLEWSLGGALLLGLLGIGLLWRRDPESVVDVDEIARTLDETGGLEPSFAGLERFDARFDPGDITLPDPVG